MDECGRGAAPAVGAQIASIPGLIRHGVAYALWDHGCDYDPFVGEHWFHDPRRPQDTGYPLESYRPPVFVVEAHAHWGFSDGPGVRTRTLVDAIKSSGARGPALAVTASGRIALVRRVEDLDATVGTRITAFHVPGYRWDAGDELP